MPVEFVEKEYPLRIERYEYAQDSGGAGKYRGGLGITREYRILAEEAVVQWRQDQSKFAAWGLAEGKSGALAQGTYTPSGGKIRHLKKEIFDAKKGDLLTPTIPGGGGFGNPWERDIARVLNDVVLEKVSLGGAERDYGVVIKPQSMVVDQKRTEELRRKMAR